MSDPLPRRRGIIGCITGNVWYRTAMRPAVHLSLAFLTLGGFIAGVAFWGAFNTALEVANTEQFCIGCHEIWGKLFGIIDTREKFLEVRPTLAAHEWARMEANRSAECRNCHKPESMNLEKQSEQAAAAHKAQLLTGEKTCIDCHKGIAHHLPTPPKSEQIEGFD